MWWKAAYTRLETTLVCLGWLPGLPSTPCSQFCINNIILYK